MPDLHVYLAFLAAVLAYQLSGVGPDMMLIISRGIGQGRRVAFATAAGCVAAGAVQVPLLALGLASLIASSPWAFELLRWIGAAYLIWLGLRLVLRRREAPGLARAEPGTTAWTAFWQGVVSNLTNPTTILFMLAVLPQFVDERAGSAALQFIVLGATVKATGFVLLGSLAFASGSAGNWIARHAGLIAWQERFTATVMIGLGLHLLLAGGRPSGR
jgi:threonine/homoserine/homoserine lactone efflux protein